MTLRIDIAGLAPDQLRFAVSPLAELTATLHVLAAPGHHPQAATWAAGVQAALPAELAERLYEAEFLWRSSRADFLLPAVPRPTLAEELDDIDRLDDEAYVKSALITTCGSSRLTFTGASPLTDDDARDRALERAQARGALQEAFAERLLADPAAVRARVRETLRQCGEAFFDRAWAAIRPRLAADLRVKADLVSRHGLARALTSASPAVSLDADGERIVVDKLQDNAVSARETGITFIPSVFGHPHLVAVHSPDRPPTLQYPVAAAAAPAPAAAAVATTVPEPAPTPVNHRAPEPPLETVQRRIEALAHPVRLRLVRTLARGPHTTGELADAWNLTSPEVSRHLAVLRQAGLLTSQRHGRYVHYTLDLGTTTSLGADLITAILR